MQSTDLTPTPTRLLITTAQEPPAPVYLQRVGEHAGRPSRYPTRNCYAVHHPHPYLYELLWSAYLCKRFRPFLRGSVIPFLTISDAIEVVDPLVSRSADGMEPHLQQLADLEQAIDRTRLRLEQLQHFQLILTHAITR